LLSNGASLVLLDAADIQTAAGDMAILRGDASSVVRMVAFSRANQHGTDVASAATLDLDAADGSQVDVTGTTDVTVITLTDGRERDVRFTGVLTLTHGSTTIVLPDSANIVTAAGDWARFRADTDRVRLVSYQKAAFPLDTKIGSSTSSTSGTSIDFTSIPSGTRSIEVFLKGCSVDSTSAMMLQIGDAGGVEATGYTGALAVMETTAVTALTTLSTGFLLNTGSTDATITGSVSLHLESTANNSWFASGTLARTDTVQMSVVAGSKDLSAELDRVRLTSVGSTGNFDAGEVNIQYRP